MHSSSNLFRNLLWGLNQVAWYILAFRRNSICELHNANFCEDSLPASSSPSGSFIYSAGISVNAGLKVLKHTDTLKTGFACRRCPDESLEIAGSSKSKDFWCVIWIVPTNLGSLISGSNSEALGDHLMLVWKLPFRAIFSRDPLLCKICHICRNNYSAIR